MRFHKQLRPFLLILLALLVASRFFIHPAQPENLQVRKASAEPYQRGGVVPMK